MAEDIENFFFSFFIGQLYFFFWKLSVLSINPLIWVGDFLGC